MEAVQLTLFGKMFPEHLAATGVTISGESCKKSQRPQFQCLNLEDGHQAEWLELNKLESFGELSTPSIGAFPSNGSESTLSAILEIDVPKKYYLSPKACQGILRRAQKRGKILPTLLKSALEAQADGKLLVTKIEGNQEVQLVGADIYNGRLTGDVAATITASTGSSATHSGASVIQAQIFDMSHASDVIRECGDKVPTLQNRMGTGGNQVPLVFEKTNIAETSTAYGICSQSSNAMKSNNPSSGFKEISVSKTLDENCCNPTCNQGGVCVVSAYAIGNGQRDNTGLHEIPGALNCMHDQQSILAAYPINTQVVTRNNKDDGRTCFGIGENGDPGYTLQAAHSHGVIYAIDRAAFNQGENALYDFQINDNEINSTIVAKGPSAVLDTRLSVWVVRRLTPTECERLQGFPDDWTKYDTYGIQIKDTPRYAALGNSIAIPCALRVFEGILDVEIGYRRS